MSPFSHSEATFFGSLVFRLDLLKGRIDFPFLDHHFPLNGLDLLDVKGHLESQKD